MWSLCQIAAVRARMRCRTRTITPAGVCPPCRSRSSWLLKVWLIDSMVWRRGLNRFAPGRSRSPWRAGRAQQCELLRGEGGFELRAVILAVGDEGLPRPGGGQGGVGGQDAEQGLAFVGFGAGQREPDGEAAEGGDQVQAQAPEVP